MYNDILTIGPVTLHGYGLMIGIGVAVALLVRDYRSKKKGLNGDLLYGLTVSTVILGFLAARILFIITEWQNFLQDPMRYITGSGFVVFGGIIGGALTIYGYCKWKKMDFWSYLDLMIPSVALAQGFGRIGCFLAGFALVCKKRSFQRKDKYAVPDVIQCGKIFGRIYKKR